MGLSGGVGFSGFVGGVDMASFRARWAILMNPTDGQNRRQTRTGQPRLQVGTFYRVPEVVSTQPFAGAHVLAQPTSGRRLLPRFVHEEGVCAEGPCTGRGGRSRVHQPGKPGQSAGGTRSDVGAPPVRHRGGIGGGRRAPRLGCRSRHHRVRRGFSGAANRQPWQPRNPHSRSARADVVRLVRLPI